VEGGIISPLPAENRLEGRFIKEKEMDDRPASPTRGRKIHRFYLDISDRLVSAEDALCQKLFSCKGTSIFHTPLAYVFPPSAVTVTPRVRDASGDTSALTGKVTAILDYGRAAYARIAIGSQTITALYDGSAGDTVNLILDQSSISIIDREADIIIV
jgi:hypothetical protein